MKRVIQLDEDGYFVGLTVADESPLEPGVFLLPARAIDVDPPTIPADHRAQWDGSNWQYVPIILTPENQETGVPEPLTQEQIVALYEQALDEHLDSVAQSDRWSNRFTFVARAGYPNRWQQEAIAFGVWMDSCNEHAYALLQQVAAGEVPMPTLEEFIDGLPEYVK